MSSVAGGIFNKRNLVKILTIFIVGFISRIFINHFFDVNVFADCFSLISISYYFIMATFVVAVNHLAEVFDFSHLLSFESIKPFIVMWGQFTNRLTKFLFNLWKPTLFDSEYLKGKGKGVETIKFGMNINSRTGTAYFEDTPIFPSQSSLPDSDTTMEEWAVWHEIHPYKRDNHLRSSNLQCLPRSSNDSSFYSDFTNDTAHSTLDNHPYYVNQYVREFREYRNNFESRDPNQIIRASKICSHPSKTNRFSVSTEGDSLKFTDKIRNDLSRFFSLNGKSSVNGGGWKKGGRSVVRYYESKEYK